MKINSCVRLAENASPEMIETHKQMGLQKLMEEAVSEMEPERWYAVKLSSDTSLEYGADGLMLKTSLTVTPAVEKTAVFISSEDIYLKDKNKTSFRQKLKNCLAYLKDKKGGKIEWRD